MPENILVASDERINVLPSYINIVRLVVCGMILFAWGIRWQSSCINSVRVCERTELRRTPFCYEELANLR